MAYIDCKLKSQILGTTVGVKLYFPTDLPADVGYTVKGVLTLLHGYTNSGDDWMQMTAAPRYAARVGVLVLGARGSRSHVAHHAATCLTRTAHVGEVDARGAPRLAAAGAAAMTGRGPLDVRSDGRGLHAARHAL